MSGRSLSKISRVRSNIVDFVSVAPRSTTINTSSSRIAYVQNASLREVPSALTPHLARNFCLSRPTSVTSAIGTLNRLCASRHIWLRTRFSGPVRTIVAENFLKAHFFVQGNGIGARKVLKGWPSISSCARSIYPLCLKTLLLKSVKRIEVSCCGPRPPKLFLPVNT